MILDLDNRALAIAAAVIALSASPARTVSAQRSDARASNIDSLKWQPSGIGITSEVLDGNPDGPGEFTIAFHMKRGSFFAPHWHPGETRFVVVSGEIQLGFGDQLDTSSATTVHAGGIGIIPATAHHFEAAKSDATLVLYGPGPLKMIMVTRAP